MKNSFLIFVLIFSIFSSCKREDLGPYQEEVRILSFSDFRNLQMGNAFQIHVKQGSQFSITVRGDRRNLDDLEVKVENNTFKAGYRNTRNRRYETVFDITMPALYGADFSGASRSTISGFSGGEKFYLTLSGASKSEVNFQGGYVTATVSGASSLTVAGTAATFEARGSGASRINGFDMAANDVIADASGASGLYVTAGKTLKADASGASKIRYRGNPTLNLNSSGASSIQKD